LAVGYAGFHVKMLGNGKQAAQDDQADEEVDEVELFHAASFRV
jgi:hypothetical protein